MQKRIEMLGGTMVIHQSYKTSMLIEVLGRRRGRRRYVKLP
jgi:hypothetical protein